MTERIEVRVSADDAHTATELAKASVRRDGYRIRTVASCRPVTDGHRAWVVTIVASKKEVTR